MQALKFSPLGLGTAPLGGLYSPVTDDDAAEALQAAWDAGIRFFDTAPQYGNGLSESRLGRFLKNKPRDDFVLATKVGRLLRKPVTPTGEDAYYKGTPEVRPVFNFSYDGIMASFEESLQRTGLDRLDILHIHDPDNHYREAIDGAFRALDSLRSQGLIRGIGAGMNQSEMLVQFANAARFDYFLLAGRYSLLEQAALDEFFPVCEEKDIGVFVGGVYNSGILANPAPGAKFNYEDASPALITRAQRMAAVCERHGVSLKAAAIQFPAAHPAVRSVLMGARNAAEVRENAALWQVAIPAALWQELRDTGLIAPHAPLPAAPTA